MGPRLPWLAFAALGASACNLIFGVEPGELEGPGGGGSTADGGLPDAAPDHVDGGPGGSDGGDGGDAGTCTPGVATCVGGVLRVCDGQGDPLPDQDCGVVAACDALAKRCLPETRLAVGQGSGCVLDDERKPRCWGYNGGLYPEEGHDMLPSATLIPGVSGGRQITIGWAQQCVLEDDGAVICWGANDNGECAQSGYTVPPGKVPLTKPALEVRAHERCTCARLSDGTVSCWGQKNTGCFGTGGSVDQVEPTPTPVPGIDDAVELEVGAYRYPTCARRASGKVWCWTADVLPAEIPGVSDAVEIATSENIVFIRSASLGVVWSSPRTDSSGWTGATPYSIPHASPIQAMAGRRSFCGLHADGAVSCARLQENGSGPTPALVPGQPGGTVLEVAVGAGDAYGRDLQCLRLAGPLSSSVYCWGDDSDGALGAGAPHVIRMPASVPGLAGAASISAFEGSSVAVMTDGSVVYWGTAPGLWNSDSLTPKAVGALGNDNAFATVGVTNSDAYVIKKSGGTILWSYAQPAPGTRLLSGSYSGFTWTKEVSHWDIGLLSDGHVVIFGDDDHSNAAGIAGDGSTSWAAGKIAVVPGLAGVRSVAAYGDAYQMDLAHACAVVGTPGTLYCWGDNDAGQLGVGPGGGFVTTPAAVALPSNDPVVSAGTGRSFTCAVGASGKVYCWGYNGEGQLGYDTGGQGGYPAPAPVDGITNAVGVTVGQAHACAWLSDASKTVRCWGWNNRGQLGDDTLDNRFTPQPVPGLSDVVEVSASPYHTCARRSDGTVACWGLSYWGEVGSGVTGSFPEPRQVVGL